MRKPKISKILSNTQPKLMQNLVKLFSTRKQLRQTLNDLKNKGPLTRSKRAQMSFSFQHEEALLAKLKNTEHQIFKTANQLRSKRANFQNFQPVRSAMTELHTISISEFSKDNDVIMIWRPINDAAADKLSNEKRHFVGKGINAKGKSSTFGPLAGIIPVKVTLSKQVLVPGADLDLLQKKNDHQLTEGLEKLENFKNLVRNASREITLKVMDEFNESMAVSAVILTAKDNRNIFSFTDDKGNDIWDEKNSLPLFAVMYGESVFRFYNPKTQDFDRSESSLLPPCFKKHPVEVMAYQHISIEGNTLKISKNPMVADYDELTSCIKKVFPESQVRSFWQRLTPTNTKSTSQLDLSADTNVEELVEELSVEVLNYELKLQEVNRSLISVDTMGLVNETQHAMKGYLKKITDGATNHGPEVNNPSPEPLSEGEYGVYTNDGSIYTLHNELEICDFINKCRQAGFPLEVNPLWGWEIDSDGVLFIPENKYNWSSVIETLRQYENAIVEKEQKRANTLNLFGYEDSPENLALLDSLDILKDRNAINPELIEKLTREKNSPPVNDTDLPKIINALSQSQRAYILSQGMFSDLKDIVNLKVEIERLRLHPRIIYCTDLAGNIEGDLSSDLVIDEAGMTATKNDIRQRVAEIVQLREINLRCHTLQELEETLSVLEDEFLIDYKTLAVTKLSEKTRIYQVSTGTSLGENHPITHNIGLFGFRYDPSFSSTTTNSKNYIRKK